MRLHKCAPIHIHIHVWLHTSWKVLIVKKTRQTNEFNSTGIQNEKFGTLMQRQEKLLHTVAGIHNPTMLILAKYCSYNHRPANHLASRADKPSTS